MFVKRIVTILLAVFYVLPDNIVELRYCPHFLVLGLRQISTLPTVKNDPITT